MATGWVSTNTMPYGSRFASGLERLRQYELPQIGSSSLVSSIQRLARELLVEHGGFIDEGGHDGGGLFQVLGGHAVINILVGVVRESFVIEGVLHKLEARQAN